MSVMISGFNVKKDLRGQKFGRLTFIEPIKRDKKRNIIWLLKCDCGNIIERISSNVTSGKSKSCGCYQREIVGNLKRLGNGQSTINAVFGQYKRYSERIGREFSLTKEEFIFMTTQDCFYCGAKPQPRKHHTYFVGEFLCNGIDRVDSSRGYVLDNCVPCCPTCNRAKNNTPINEFLSWVSMVYNHSCMKEEKSCQQE